MLGFGVVLYILTFWDSFHLSVVALSQGSFVMVKCFTSFLLL